MLSDRFPQVTTVQLPANIGFGRAVNRGVREVDGADVIVLVNNDAVCAPEFIERLLEPFADTQVGMVAGVLLQGSVPGLIDSAGIELDMTLRSWDMLWNEPLQALSRAGDPVGPCGGAAAYRAEAFVELGGFDERFFAYWEDVDLALRFRLAGWSSVRAPDARAIHRHGATLGAASPAQRKLEAYGRALRARQVPGCESGISMRLKIAALDWPVLGVHLLLSREVGPLRARMPGGGTACGRTTASAPRIGHRGLRDGCSGGRPD